MSTTLPLSGSVDTRSEVVATDRILPIGALAVILAVVGNLIVRAIGLQLVDVSPEFMPLASPGPVVFFSVIGVVLAVAVFWMIALRARRPFTTFRTVATVALIASLVPNVLLLLNGSGVPGSSTGAVIILIVMHVVAYLASVGVLTTLTRETNGTRR